MYGYKTGAKQEDKNAIKRYLEQGMTVDQISRQLRIVTACVESFVDLYSGKGNKEKTPAHDPVLNSEEVEAVMEAFDEQPEAQETSPKRRGRPSKNNIAE